MKKWTIGVTLVVVMLAAFGATALAPLDAASRDDAQAQGDKKVETRPESGVKIFTPPDLGWEDNPDVPGVQNAAGVGDPTKPELYTSFGKIEEGVRFPSHTHPDARITTVLAGVMFYGAGERLDRVESKPYPAGSVIYTPPGTPHVMWAKEGEIVVQESGYGPTDIEFTSNEE